jgi:hypothetical protein
VAPFVNELYPSIFKMDKAPVELESQHVKSHLGT